MNALDSLISSLRTLPGVGKRAAQKMALQLLLDRDDGLRKLQTALAQADAEIVTCSLCNNLDAHNPCHLCTDDRRNDNIICVVPHVSDVWALERIDLFKGRYHILGGLLSAMNNVGPDDLYIENLKSRVTNHPHLKEIIFALPANVEGASTTHHLINILSPLCAHNNVTFTKLAHGMPMGGHLEAMDDGTLSMALSGRGAI